MERLKELSVLYAEDDPYQRNWFADAMGPRFGELRTAANGEEALAIYQERPCDLLITDLVMPGMDGLTLCRAIRGYSLDMPIVITSATLSRTMLVESMNVGVDGYILKPLEMEMIDSVLSQAVSRLFLRRQSIEAARFWQQTFDAVPDMIAVLDRDFRVMRLNRAARQYLAVDEKSVLGNGYCSLIHQENQGDDRCELFRQAIDSGGSYVSDTPVEMLGGYYHVTLSPLRDVLGEVTGAVHVARDVTELKRAEDALRYTSTHDPLTGLYNRAWFEAEFDRLSRGRTTPVSVLVADLDGLKQVNDRIGHKAGDELLCRAASLLVNCCRADDCIARIGGDEFTVLLPGVGESDASDMVARIRRKMQQEPKTTQGHAVSLSLGIATTDTPLKLAEALALADRRMYQDKALRRYR